MGSDMELKRKKREQKGNVLLRPTPSLQGARAMGHISLVRLKYQILPSVEYCRHAIPSMAELFLA